MSRELLFRGQTRKKGERVRLDGTPIDSNWVYGCGAFAANDDIAIIYQSKPEFKKYSVYPFSARRPPPLRWGMNCVPVPNVLDNKFKI